MKLDSIKKACEILMNAEVPALIEGPHGIGKSSAVIQLYEEEKARRAGKSMASTVTTVSGRTAAMSDVGLDEFGFWSFSAGSILAEELIGVPVPQPDGTVRYHLPQGVLPPPGHRGGGVVLIDEINRADPQVKNAVMQIVLDRRLFSYRVPDGIWFAATQNPPSSMYQTTRMNPAIIERFGLFFAEPDVSLSAKIVSTISEDVALVMSSVPVADDLKQREFTTRKTSMRSWEMAAKIVHTVKGKTFETEDLINALSSVVGTSNATVIAQSLGTVTGMDAFIIDTELLYGDRRSAVLMRNFDLRIMPAEEQLLMLSSLLTICNDIISSNAKIHGSDYQTVQTKILYAEVLRGGVNGPPEKVSVRSVLRAIARLEKASMHGEVRRSALRAVSRIATTAMKVIGSKAMVIESEYNEISEQLEKSIEQTGRT